MGGRHGGILKYSGLFPGNFRPLPRFTRQSRRRLRMPAGSSLVAPTASLVTPAASLVVPAASLVATTSMPWPRGHPPDDGTSTDRKREKPTTAGCGGGLELMTPC